jgi:hypothetical protein
VLEPIGHTLHGGRQRAASLRHGGDTLVVHTGAKSPAFAGEHRGAQASIVVEPRAGFGDRFEHSRIERVHLGRAIEPDFGDAVRDRQSDPIFHGTISFNQPCDHPMSDARRLPRPLCVPKTLSG